MTQRELREFVREAAARGAPRERVAAALAAAGWPAQDVDAALGGYAASDLGIAVPRPARYATARSAFLHLVLFILLAVVVWNVGAIWFAIIDALLPDPLQEGLALLPGDALIRSALAAVIVAAPLFAWLSFDLHRRGRGDPALLRSRARAWITAAALLVAALTLLGVAVGLVYALLAGDLTAGLFAKLLLTAALAGGVFAYYHRDLDGGDERAQPA